MEMFVTKSALEQALGCALDVWPALIQLKRVVWKQPNWLLHDLDRTGAVPIEVPAAAAAWLTVYVCTGKVLTTTLCELTDRMEDLVPVTVELPNFPHSYTVAHVRDALGWARHMHRDFDGPEETASGVRAVTLLERILQAVVENEKVKNEANYA